MAGVNKCLKYSMFTFNFLFWLCGCVILGVSIYLRVSKDARQELNLGGTGIMSGIDVMIAVGSIIMVLGFFGCCGAVKESRCLLILFFIGLLLILALQVTAGVLGVVYKPKINAAVNQSLHALVPLSAQSLEFQQGLQALQKEIKCCGLIDGYKDWDGASSEGTVSCKCTLASDPDTCGTNGYFKETCRSAFVEYFNNHLVIIMGIAFGLIVVELFGLGFSMTLYCQIGKK